MRVLDLFSGIGGFSLGLERAGMQTVAFCEIDPFCRRVLAKHWSGVPIYDDIRSLTSERLRADGVDADILCGGFPCQDISTAGKGAGIDGERSGLWAEYARLIGEVRPRYVIVENVAALLGRGLDRVLGDLAALGFDAEWHCIPASAVGAPHRRDRIWVLAYSASARCRSGQSSEGEPARHEAWWPRPERLGRDVADAGQSRLSSSEREAILSPRRWHEGRAATERDWWRAEPDVGRVVDGPASRLDRRKRLIGIGNAVVPQIPEIIGQAILVAESAMHPPASECTA